MLNSKLKAQNAKVIKNAKCKSQNANLKMTIQNAK